MVPGQEGSHVGLCNLLTRYARDHGLRFITDSYHDVRWYQLAWWVQDRQNLIKLWVQPAGLQVVLQQTRRHEGCLALADWALRRKHPAWFRAFAALPMDT